MLCGIYHKEGTSQLVHVPLAGDKTLKGYTTASAAPSSASALQVPITENTSAEVVTAFSHCNPTACSAAHSGACGSPAPPVLAIA